MDESIRPRLGKVRGLMEDDGSLRVEDGDALRKANPGPTLRDEDWRFIVTGAIEKTIAKIVVPSEEMAERARALLPLTPVPVEVDERLMPNDWRIVMKADASKIRCTVGFANPEDGA